MKIVKFIIQNYKAVRGTLEFQPEGSSFFLLGGNGVGKTSVGHALMDMLTKSLPSKPITEGEKTGYIEFTFSNGAKFLGRFIDGKKPQLEFITPDGYNVGSPKELLQKLAGEGMDFSIDDMLKMSPAPLRKKLETIAGLDLTEINDRYQKTYQDRTLANAQLRDQQGRIEPYEQKFVAMEIVPAATIINKIQLLQTEMQAYDAKVGNKATLQKNLDDQLSRIQTKKEEQVEYIAKSIDRIMSQYDADLLELEQYYKDKKAKIESTKSTAIATQEANVLTMENAINDLQSSIPGLQEQIAMKQTEIDTTSRPAQQEIDALNAELTNLEESNKKIEHAKKMHSEFVYYEELEKKAADLNSKVNAIIAEKEEKIKASPLPASGLAFDADGNLTIDGFPFEDAQISASRKLRAGIEIAQSLLGDIKYLHIDGAALDHASADSLLEFAEAKGLQLCIERPEWDGGELKFEIADHTCPKHEESPQEPSPPVGNEIAPDANTIAPNANELASDANPATAQQPE